MRTTLWKRTVKYRISTEWPTDCAAKRNNMSRYRAYSWEGHDDYEPRRRQGPGSDRGEYYDDYRATTLAAYALPPSLPRPVQTVSAPRPRSRQPRTTRRAHAVPYVETRSVRNNVPDYSRRRHSRSRRRSSDGHIRGNPWLSYTDPKVELDNHLEPKLFSAGFDGDETPVQPFSQLNDNFNDNSIQEYGHVDVDTPKPATECHVDKDCSLPERNPPKVTSYFKVAFYNVTDSTYTTEGEEKSVVGARIAATFDDKGGDGLFRWWLVDSIDVQSSTHILTVTLRAKFPALMNLWYVSNQS